MSQNIRQNNQSVNWEKMQTRIRSVEVAHEPFSRAEVDDFLTISLKRANDCLDPPAFPCNDQVKRAIKQLLAEAVWKDIKELKVLNPSQCWVKLNFRSIAVSASSSKFASGHNLIHVVNIPYPTIR